MDEQAYKTWWPLHMRVAKGETLNPQEQAVHDAGQQQLYAEEKLDNDIKELQQTRQRMLILKAAYNSLRARYEQIEAETAALERKLLH